MNRIVSLKWTEHSAGFHNHWILTVGEDALLHWEALFVVSAGDAEDVAFPFVTEMVSFDFSSHTFFVEHSQDMVIDHLKGFLGPGSGVRDVQLKREKKIRLKIPRNCVILWHHFEFR